MAIKTSSGLTIHGMDAEGETRIRSRDAFITAYCKDKGWDPKDLDMTKVIEIRQQEGWKNP